MMRHANRMAEIGGVGIVIPLDVDAPHEPDEFACLRVDARAWDRLSRRSDGSPWTYPAF
jgi:hypothetical protein